MNVQKIEQIVQDQNILPKTDKIIALGIRNVTTKIKEVFRIAQINKYENVETNVDQLIYCVEAAMSGDESTEEADNFLKLRDALVDHHVDDDGPYLDYTYVGTFVIFCLYMYFGLDYAAYEKREAEQMKKYEELLTKKKR